MLLHYLAKRGNTKVTYFTQSDCVTQTMHLCAIFLKEKKLSSVMCLIASNINFVEVVIYPINTVHWLYSRLDEKQLRSFTQRLTASQTWLTQSMWVTHNRMLCSLPRFCLVLPLDHFDSEGWFSSDQVILLTAFRVFWLKKHAASKWKNAIFGFPVSPGSAEALVRCGGKIKYILITYFLRNSVVCLSKDGNISQY